MHIYIYIYSPPASMSWWRHQMKPFSALLALWEGNPPVTGGLPSQRLMMRLFDVLFDVLCGCTNGWANDRNTGDLRHHRTQNYVTVMVFTFDVHVSRECPRSHCFFFWRCQELIKKKNNSHLRFSGFSWICIRSLYGPDFPIHRFEILPF